MTLPLASWLACPWRHTKGEGYGVALSAALKLDQRVWDLHKIKLLMCPDPWRFRDISTEEVKRANVGRASSPEEAGDFPQLGTHADPTCRHLTSDNFYALIGTKTDRPLPLLTMNSAALYDGFVDGMTIGALFGSRVLWSDQPDRDCAGLSVELSRPVDSLCIPLPAVFLGTAWTLPEKRGRGIMREVSRLHRMVAYLRYGALPQFATVIPESGHEKVFGGRDIGAVIETWPTHKTTARVLFYEAKDIVADASDVLATSPTERQ